MGSSYMDHRVNLVGPTNTNRAGSLFGGPYMESKSFFNIAAHLIFTINRINHELGYFTIPSLR